MLILHSPTTPTVPNSPESGVVPPPSRSFANVNIKTTPGTSSPDWSDAEVARSRWWEGWGIRITPRGMLYNVSGTDAVEINLRSGQRLWIGTDEPEALAQALRIAISRPRQS